MSTATASAPPSLSRHLGQSSSGASRLIHLVPQLGQHLLQEGESPTPLEDLLWRTLQGDFRQPLLCGVVV
jgi:hypothetical protein